MKEEKTQQNFFKKLFGETAISWQFLLIFAVLAGVFTGIIACLPFLAETSFHDIAVVFDVWIVFAIFILMNSKTRKDAVLKCFVFFLVSQPLIYLTEAVINSLFFGADFSSLIFEYFNNYYFHGGNWFLWTLLTIPGAAIGFEIKKNNTPAALILSVATGYLAFVGGYGLLNSFFRTFPNHLLSAIFCLFAAFSLCFVVLKEKKPRIISLIISAVLFLAGIIVFSVTNFSSTPKTHAIIYSDETVISEIVSSDDSLVKIEISEDGKEIKFTSTGVFGTAEIELKDSAGKVRTYFVESISDGLFVSEL